MTEEEHVYEVELVGGPFDGASNLTVAGDPQPPPMLWVFTCRGEWCRRDPTFTINGRHHSHTWVAFPDAAYPPEAVRYERSDVGTRDGRSYAVYARGGVRPVGGARELARAGAGGGKVVASMRTLRRRYGFAVSSGYRSGTEQIAWWARHTQAMPS